MDAEPHARHAAHRQSTKRKVPDVRLVCQTQDVASQLLERVWPGSNLALPMPARVITQHAEMLPQLRHLRIPHGEIGAERIGEHQCRRVRQPLDLIMNVTAVDVCDRHFAKRAPESRRFPGRLQCTWCRAHIAFSSATVDTSPWLP